MANDDRRNLPPGDPDALPDVPTGTAIVRDQKEAAALAKKMGGETPPDECEFHCISCGKRVTLKFEQDEIEAMDGDITTYSGPCPSCSYMTLRPREHLLGPEFKSISQRQSEIKKQEYEQQADVFVDRVKQEVGGIFQGTAAHRPGEEFGDEPENIDEEAVPGQKKQDLPDADDVDLSDLKGR